jgi:hypothetical protein
MKRYRSLYGCEPPTWKFGNEPETVVAWIRECVARKGRKPPLTEVQEVFRLPKTTAWRRLRSFLCAVEAGRWGKWTVAAQR